jgi:nucleoside-diphosphate-sugar epimerase
MSHTALITGATGLLGREVTKAFKQAGWLTVGQGFNRAAPPTILKANLEDPSDVKRIIDEAKYVVFLLGVFL